MDTVIAFVAFFGVIALVVYWYRGAKRAQILTKRLRDEGAKRIVCPHCGVRGCVSVLPIGVARGVSGGKLAGAWFTGGLSILLTGLSRDQRVTQAKCSNCLMTWVVE